VFVGKYWSICGYFFGLSSLSVQVVISLPKKSGEILMRGWLIVVHFPYLQQDIYFFKKIIWVVV
jgi:hypothetical protein